MTLEGSGEPRERPREPEGSRPARPASRRRPVLRTERLREVTKWRGDVPTGPLPMREVLRRTPYRDPRVTRSAREEREVLLALDLALTIAETLVRCGAGAPQVEASVVAVAAAAGIEEFETDITVQSIFVQARTPSGQWVTRLRVVRDQRRDFSRLGMVHELIDDLVSGSLDLPAASSRMEQIAKTPRPWSDRIVTLASGLLAAGVAVLLGAGWQPAVIALGSAITVQLVIDRLAGGTLPDFYRSAVGGFLAMCLAWTAYALGHVNVLSVTAADFAAIMAGGIVALLPARSIASAMEDVVMGYPVTGTSRIFAVLFHTLGLILGVAAGLSTVVAVADLLGLALSPPSVERISGASAPLITALMGAAVIGMTGAMTMQSRRRFLLPSAALAVLGVFINWGLGRGATVGPVMSVGLSCIVLGFLARVIALRMRSPAIVLAVPASLGMLPGLAIFVGLYRLMVPAGGVQTALGSSVGWQGLVTALGVLVAIATGMTLGEILAAPLDRGVWQRRRAGRARQARDAGTPQ